MEKVFIFETDIQATALTSQYSGILVWLTSASTGDAVEDAQVYIYENSNPSSKARFNQ